MFFHPVAVLLQTVHTFCLTRCLESGSKYGAIPGELFLSATLINPAEVDLISNQKHAG